MHGNREFAKINGCCFLSFFFLICNIPIEAANICNILPRPADSNRLIVVKLRRDPKYRVYVCFEPVCTNVTHQVLN